MPLSNAHRRTCYLCDIWRVILKNKICGSTCSATVLMGRVGLGAIIVAPFESICATSSLQNGLHSKLMSSVPANNQLEKPFG